MKVELRGLELHGYHGVLPEERERGQRFVVDVVVEPRETVSSRSDRIEDAVDYREIVAIVQEVSGGRAFHLLEAFAAAIADTLLRRLPLAAATVTVRKPEVRLALPVEHAAVTVERRVPGS